MGDAGRRVVFQRDAILDLGRAVLAVRSEHHPRILPANARLHAKAPFLVPTRRERYNGTVSLNFFFRDHRVAPPNQLCDLHPVLPKLPEQPAAGGFQLAVLVW